MLITCLRCPRGLHATTETMNLRVSLALSLSLVYTCVRASARGYAPHRRCRTCGLKRGIGRERGCPVNYIRSYPAYASVVLRPTCRSCRIRFPTSRVTLADERSISLLNLMEIDRQRQNREETTAVQGC